MNEIASLIREFGPWVLIVAAIVVTAYLGVFIWFAKKMFDKMD